MDDRREQLDALIARRDKVQQETQKLRGRLEAAREEVSRVEEECRSKGLDPSKLDEHIRKLSERYVQAVQELENQVAQAEAGLAPFLQGDG